MDGFLVETFIYLFAAVVAVPFAKRLGLGSVPGYLIAGMVIGPGGLGVVGIEIQNLQHLAELGIVMMLFLVGLELKPMMFWDMGARLLRLGSLQVALSTLAIAAVTLMLGQSWQIALVSGLVLSLSSTASVLQTLNETGQVQTEGARAGVSVLLLQNVSVIPMFTLIPLLAAPELLDLAAQGEAVVGLATWQVAITSVSAIMLVVVGGHYLARPLFRFVAGSHLPEMFTAAALLIVIAIAVLMILVGLSPALGTFLAGVVLANSEYRHELESNIEPFKGLLLGLFFITVGAGIDFGTLFESPALVLTLTLTLILAKAFVLWVLALVFGMSGSDRWLFVLALVQAGELGFVLISLSLQNSVLPEELAAILSLVVALSMLLTPLGLRVTRRWTWEGSRWDVGPGALCVFLSYARNDLDEMLEIAARLERNGFEVVFDTRSLPFGEKWKIELRYLIERSDIVVWLVSPSSVESYWCNWELSQVTELGKKFVPVALQEVALRDLPEAISERQILPGSGCFNPRDRGDMAALVTLLGNDHSWLKLYSRLSDRALAWGAAGRDPERLLTPSELAEAESWRNGRPVRAPEPMPLVLDLIHSSRVALSRRDATGEANHAP